MSEQLSEITKKRIIRWSEMKLDRLKQQLCLLLQPLNAPRCTSTGGPSYLGSETSRCEKKRKKPDWHLFKCRCTSCIRQDKSFLQTRTGFHLAAPFTTHPDYYSTFSHTRIYYLYIAPHQPPQAILLLRGKDICVCERNVNDCCVLCLLIKNTMIQNRLIFHIHTSSNALCKRWLTL